METVSTMGSGSLGRELDLDALVNGLEDYHSAFIKPNFTNNAMVTIRFDKDGPAFTIYRTGSFQIRGAKTEDRLTAATERFRKVLSDIGVEMDDYEFQHVTSVFMDDLGRDVNLEAAIITLGMGNCEYEPEQFPGLIYRAPGYELTMLVFSSGKVIISGTTDREEAVVAIGELQEELETMNEF